jgi:DNA-damage-inducible protein J
MATVRARIDDQTKEAANYYLGRLGLTTSAAINVFFKQIVSHRRLPFALQVPVAEFDSIHPEYQGLIDEVSSEYLHEAG